MYLKHFPEVLFRHHLHYSYALVLSPSYFWQLHIYFSFPTVLKLASGFLLPYLHTFIVRVQGVTMEIIPYVTQNDIFKLLH